MALPDSDELRREAVGAFVHEMRTPLTSLRMVLEIARRSSPGPGITLDDELLSMVEDAIGNLQGLADELQDTSRLDRGRIAPSPIPCRLSDFLARLQTTANTELDLRVEAGDIEAEWDVERLLAALCSFAEAVRRCGGGGNAVACVAESNGDSCTLRFTSGSPRGQARPVNSDLGFGFFRASTLVHAMGGAVDVERSEGFCEISVSLPARPQ